MIIDHCRDEQEFYSLYNSIDNSNLPYPKDILALKDYCFCFYSDEGKLLGVIYLEGKDDKTYLSGFSIRKNYKNILTAINSVCNYFSDDDIYSETPHLHAKIMLKKCGFKQIKENLFIKRSK